MSLYRIESMEAQADRFEGEILLARSWSSWVIFWLVSALVLATITYLFFASYTKRANALGALVPGSGAIPITAPAPGIISEIRVEEGQFVQAGDLLFTLKDERHLSSSITHPATMDNRFADRVEDALRNEEEAKLREKEQMAILSKKNDLALSRQLGAIKIMISDVKQQLIQHNQRVALAEQKLQKHQGLAVSGFIAKDKLNDEVDNLALLRAQALELKRNGDELSRKMLELEDERRSSPEKTKIDIANIDQELSVLRQKMQERYIQDQLSIVAPVDGIITGITVHLGQNADNQALATLLAEDAELSAQLYITTREVGFVEVGQNVRLRYHAYPYQKFGQYSGSVIAVSQNPVASSSLPKVFANTTPDDFYRVTVKLDSQFAMVYGEQKKLVSGMLLEADIEQDTRKLIEWIIEPLYGLTKYN